MPSFACPWRVRSGMMRHQSTRSKVMHARSCARPGGHCVSAIAVCILTLAVMVLFWSSASPETCYWTDAATFALNGALVRDHVAAGFPKSPIAFANAWFLHYPALTISLYPPIFPVAEAISFALLGFSNASAQATSAAFCALAAYGAYQTARTALRPLEAAGLVLILFATPTFSIWSRQVMMEVPSLAFLLLGSAFLLNYQATSRIRQLWLAVCMVLAAAYTKQTAIFAAPAFAAAILI